MYLLSLKKIRKICNYARSAKLLHLSEALKIQEGMLCVCAGWCMVL